MAAEVGYDGIEIMVEAPLDTRDARYLRRLSAQCGLPIGEPNIADGCVVHWGANGTPRGSSDYTDFPRYQISGVNYRRGGRGGTRCWLCPPGFACELRCRRDGDHLPPLQGW